MTNTPSGTGLDAAANAFEAYLTGSDADTGAAPESDTEADAGSDEGDAEAQPDEDSSTTPEDEVEVDETDAEEPEEEDESTDDEPAIDAPEVLTSKITVKNGDTIEEITVEEARKGWMRQSSYTRATQSLAEERKALHAEVNRDRSHLASLIPAVEKQIADHAPQEPADWDSLWRNDPIEAARLDQTIRMHRELTAAVQAEKDQIEAALAKQKQAQSEALQAQEWNRVLEAQPEWRDPKAWSRASAAILQYAEAQGYDARDLAAADGDHRILLTLHKAAQWDALQRSKPQPKPAQRQDAPRPAAPSSKASARPVSELTRAKQRLAKTGKISDAAAIFEKLI